MRLTYTLGMSKEEPRPVRKFGFASGLIPDFDKATLEAIDRQFGKLFTDLDLVHLDTPPEQEPPCHSSEI